MLSNANQESDLYKSLKAGFLIRQTKSSSNTNPKEYEVVKQLSDNITNTGGAVYLVKEHTQTVTLATQSQMETKSMSHNPPHMISGASK